MIPGMSEQKKDVNSLKIIGKHEFFVDKTGFN
jgi:hypothetical protein